MIVSIIQLTSNNNINNNITKSIKLIETAFEYKPDVIALPENFVYMIKEGNKPQLVENLYNNVLEKLQKLALKGNCYIIAGTIPEPSNDVEKFYNTCTVINRKGKIITKYRKIHLFDISLNDRELKESKYIKRGEKPIVFRIDDEIICGLTICYDLRFPELFRKLVNKGAKLIFVPSAFTMTTGKDHWEILLRARAIENQAYIIAPAQYGKHEDGRMSYGHSMIIDPWGIVTHRKGEGEGIITGEINIDYVNLVRKKIPALDNRFW